LKNKKVKIHEKGDLLLFCPGIPLSCSKSKELNFQKRITKLKIKNNETEIF